MAKSYFAILGLPPDASLEEIRAAYRRLAKEFHPDHFEGGNERFLQIQEAYSVLNDPQKRSTYEQSSSDYSIKPSAPRRRYSEPEPLIPERDSVYIGDISPLRSFETFVPSLDEIFDRLWNSFSTTSWPKSGRLQNLTLEVSLTTDQALRGGRARIMVPARGICRLCNGHGGVGFYECPRCDGEGVIVREVPISVSFPAGLRRDHTVVIPLERFGLRDLQLTVLFRPTDDL